VRELSQTRIETEPEGNLRRESLIAFVGAGALSFILLLLRIQSGWVDAFFLLASAVTTLIGLGKRLPIQNVAAATIIIITGSALAYAINAWTGIPFGPVKFSPEVQPQFLGGVPWFIPLLWATLILTGRGVARLVARPRRKGGYYGFYVIGLTVALLLLTQLALEPYGQTVRGYWSWKIGPRVWNWYGTPWSHFLGCAVAGLLILVIGTPWFINKQPVKLSPDFHPLAVWGVLMVYLIAAAARENQWVVVASTLPLTVASAWLAIAGARDRPVPN
jgi:uncharacterized membrane protein